MLKFFHWEIEVDAETTKRQYEKDWELCQCEDCLNFYRAMENLSDAENEVFAQLGIKPTKCVHLSSFEVSEEGLILYMASFHFVGKILLGNSVNVTEWDEKNVTKVGNLTFVLSDDLMFVPEGFPTPALQLDVNIELPWILGER